MVTKIRRVEISYYWRNNGGTLSPKQRVTMCKHEDHHVVTQAPLRGGKDIVNGWRSIRDLQANPRVEGWQQFTRTLDEKDVVHVR